MRLRTRGHQFESDDLKLYSLLDLGLSADLCTACNLIAKWAKTWQMRVV